MKKLFFTPIIIFIAFFSFAQGQDSTKKASAPAQARAQAAAPQNTDRSLSGQYRYLLTKTYNYQQPVIGAFYRNVMDTIKTERAALRKAQATVASQAAIIKKLNVDVTVKDETISAANSRVDQINLLGISLTKAAYNTLMWGLVLGFGIALAIVIITTTRFRQEAKYRIKLYNELSEEFQTYKTKANEKEKKLARELQTERNKLDELMGR
ncbi:hypothetical protein LT679_11350 [Mucilaginibacter roseus]|uniref:tRNA (Guanine-N1)-methyltransferase n=1 Tax=Mucilaginibacter roseus TaxID=1528868 RepID=A0ABS8U511_9SPHI|nr:hypothetical protein [Mucilaginibacter roseus]MCD8741200.1 hypothetical protein [Mucilaginibacter roseus]